MTPRAKGGATNARPQRRIPRLVRVPLRPVVRGGDRAGPRGGRGPKPGGDFLRSLRRERFAVRAFRSERPRSETPGREMSARPLDVSRNERTPTEGGASKGERKSPGSPAQATAVVVAADDRGTAADFRTLLASEDFRVFTSDDVHGLSGIPTSFEIRFDARALRHECSKTLSLTSSGRRGAPLEPSRRPVPARPRVLDATSGARLSKNSEGYPKNRWSDSTQVHAVPVQHSRRYLRKIAKHVPRGAPVLCTSKGIDLCGIPPLVLGYPKNSSKISTAVKSNPFPTILGPFVLTPRVLDD